MRYSFYIDYVGTGYIEAFPDNVSPFKITRGGNDSAGMSQYFYRIEWGEIQLSNNPKLFADTGLNIYRLFEVIYNLDFSTRVLVKYETDVATIVGYFGRNDCKFDFDRKIVTVEPAVLDDYTDILENWETDVNFNNYEIIKEDVTIEIANSSLKTIQDWPPKSAYGTNPDAVVNVRNRIKEKDYDNNGELNLYFDGEGPKDELWTDSYYGFFATHAAPGEQALTVEYNLQDRSSILGQSVTPENRDTVPDTQGDYELSAFRVYEGSRTGGLSGKRWRNLYCETKFSRDEIIKEDVELPGSDWGFEPPVGEGWSMRGSRVKGGQDAHLWTRKPFNGAFSEAWLKGAIVDNNDGTDYDINWHRYLETKLQYDNTGTSFNLVSSIPLKDFLTYCLQNTSDELSTMELRSTFFFNDDEVSLEVLKNTTGFNYVTGSKNYLNGCRIFFTRDLVDSEETEIDDIPLFSLKDILNDLNKEFADQLIWFIDGEGYFRIEHNRYVDLRKTSIDLTSSELLIFTSQWDYDKSKMFEKFIYNQINSGYVDFTNNTIKFDKIISNNRNQDLEYESITKYFSTDAKYCVLNPSDITSGIVLITVDDNNVVLNKVGQISDLVETNGFLATSNILLDFAVYSGVWHYGLINNVTKNFQVTNRNKLGIDITVKGTLLSLFYTTQIGTGLIEEGTVDFENENTKLRLRYRYNSGVNGDVFALAFQKSTDFEGAVNTWADIDNYIINP